MRTRIIPAEDRERLLLKKHIKNALVGASLGAGGVSLSKLFGGDPTGRSIIIAGGSGALIGLLASLLNTPSKAKKNVTLAKISSDIDYDKLYLSIVRTLGDRHDNN